MEQPSKNNFDFDFIDHVSRETKDRLIIYYDLLLKWQPKINLVSPSTLKNAWERHFLDSAQIFKLISGVEKPIFDLGSGGGFPGMIISILGASDMHLIESDQRKCIFLSEVARETQTNVAIHTTRIEKFAPQNRAGVITSRALASVKELLEYSEPLLMDDGYCLFMKGRQADDELEEASQSHLFHVEHFASETEQDAKILKLSAISRKE